MELTEKDVSEGKDAVRDQDSKRLCASTRIVDGRVRVTAQFGLQSEVAILSPVRFSECGEYYNKRDETPFLLRLTILDVLSATHSGSR